MWSAGLTCYFGQSFNLSERGPKRLFDHAWHFALKKFDSHFNDCLHWHHTHARIRFFNQQHLIEVVIVPLKTKRTAELGCSLGIEITRRDKLEFVGVRSRIARERSGVACSGMFAAT